MKMGEFVSMVHDPITAWRVVTFQADVKSTTSFVDAFN
jgi:hypothetical protein